jgi:structure-specific recognition protein 1
VKRKDNTDRETIYRESFDDIYLDLSQKPGKCRFAESGLGWKPVDGHTFTLDRDQILQGQWSRASRGHEVKVYTRSSGVIQLDGFLEDDFERLSKVFKNWYGTTLENKEHSLRGWNWGKAEFGKAELAFNVQNRPAFEIPYSEIINTNLAGKNEVAVDFSLPTSGEKENGVNGHSKVRGSKAGGARDQLVEMRFYIPGTVTKKVKKEEDGEQENGEQSEQDGEEDEEEQNAAQLFYETLVEKAEIGEVAGDTFATFLDVLHLTPRGRFDIDMYETSFRLRGKTYDYKIQFDSIKKLMLLPKPDDVHYLIVIGLEPPLRQGQTRYPFVVMQFKKDEEVTLDMNMTEEQLSKYEGKIQSRYEAPIANVISYVFRGLTGRRVTQPSKDFSSHHNQCGVKCSIKANEGHLFCLDKSFIFVPKPATYITIDNIHLITLSRVGGAVSASRTFDITITMKGGAGEYQFSNINRSEDPTPHAAKAMRTSQVIELTHIDREEQQPLEDFFKTKNIRYKNEMADDSRALLAAALKDDADLASSDEDEVVRANRGSADEDSEEADEDFQESDESEVAEEFDSNAASDSSGDEDEEMPDADDGVVGEEDDDDDDEEERRPKKKAKAAK